MSSLPVIRGGTRILDFDIENRPLSYWVPDRPTAEITSIAWAFVDKPFDVECVLLGQDDPRLMLERFSQAWDQADLVTGHYVLRHDIPIIQAHLVEYGLAPLSPKLVSDTKVHLMGWKDIPKTQEHLAFLMGISSPKIGMSQARWRDANRLTESGLKATRERVVGDVRQHMELRAALVKRGLLGPPRVWQP
jgi:hypothetical protein